LYASVANAADKINYAYYDNKEQEFK